LRLINLSLTLPVTNYEDLNVVLWLTKVHIRRQIFRCCLVRDFHEFFLRSLDLSYQERLDLHQDRFESLKYSPDWMLQKALFPDDCWKQRVADQQTDFLHRINQTCRALQTVRQQRVKTKRTADEVPLSRASTISPPRCKQQKQSEPDPPALTKGVADHTNRVWEEGQHLV